MRFEHRLHDDIRLVGEAGETVTFKARHEAGLGSAAPGQSGSRVELSRPRGGRIFAQPTGSPTMIKTIIKGAPLALVAAIALSAPADAAGLCPKPGSMNLANAPTMPKGVTDTILASVDLRSEIGVEGRM